MIAKTYSCALAGFQPLPIQVETGISGGLPDLIMVGLPDTAVRESRERVRSAIRCAGFDWPARRILVNLAPAHLRKEGSGYDLAVAVGILKATGQLPGIDMNQYLFAAELSIDGAVRPIRGILAIALCMVQWPQKYLVVAAENQYEALKGTDRVIAVRHLSQIGELQLMPLAKKSPAADQVYQVEPAAHDMMEVCGQPQARHALEIAAAGRHSLLLVGPPGCGKSLLARCLPSIMPPLNEAEAIEVNKIYSVAGLLCDDQAWIANSPFRDPHVRITRAGMLGGGSPFKPGEISLAHHGVLYLDEIPEMDRVVLESLRQPLEDGSITIRQAWGAYHLPADFQLVGSANPCYCGYHGDGKEPCRCTAHQLKQYRNKLSGPLLDRIAMQVLVPRVQLESLQGEDGIPEASATIRQRVCQVRALQQSREKDGSWGISELHGCLTKAAINLLKQFDAAAQLTARSYTKVLKVARTIADLSGQDAINAEAVAEAFQFRQ